MSERRVTFEAELHVEGLPEGFGLDVPDRESPEYGDIVQLVQDAIGHTGAVVTDILYVDAST